MKPRPKRHDPAIILAAAKDIAPRVIAWLGADAPTPNDSVIADLCRAARHSFDGYAIAKELDHILWYPDALLVEILDDFHSFAWTAHTDAVKRWVVEHAIKPDRAIGDEVRTRHGVGKIVQVRAETAEYLVKHATDSETTIGIVVPYEDVALADQVAA